MVKAIFFDLDGVLINSEWQDQLWTQQYAKSLGLTIPKERFTYLIGTNRKQNPWIKILEGYEDEVSDVEQFKDDLIAFKEEKRRNFDFNEVLFQEVPEVLKTLKEAGIFLACASSSTPEYIHQALNQIHCIQYFDLICSGHDFKESKPAPDIYEHCLKSFGLKREECLVVEDSSLGIQAGKSAGLKVVARFTPFNLDQSQADYKIDTLDELLKIIKKL